MKSVEIEGKTIDEAIEKACQELQSPREKLNIEIVSEGTAGFLGFGNKKARVKATLLSFDEDISDSLYSRPEAAAPSNLPDTTSSQYDSKEETKDSTAEKAKEILQGILKRMNLDYPVSMTETSDKIVLNIKGNGGGLLIGRRGQNLDALQYIVNKASHKSDNGQKKIIVDTESYRQRREEALIALAAEISAKVKKTRKSVTLNYLNAHNRRIIHMALQNDPAISTKSRGEGEYRKIVIVPAKKE